MPRRGTEGAIQGNVFLMYWSLLPFLAIVIVTAGSGVFFTPGAWYETLRKPWWTPPNWLFGPVWSTLYIMIAVAGWLVWRSEGVSAALFLWGVNLVFNALWSYFFFGMRRMDIAFGDAILMWLTIACFILLAWPVSSVAALLFVPYLVWVTIAATLNITVWRLNPAA
jgi:tryptophan-rich sensory protein